MPKTPVTLPEIIAYAKTHEVGIDEAYRHFAGTARIATSEPPPPICDGWTMPRFELQWSPEAIDRANRLSTVTDAESAIRNDLELLFIDLARRRAKSKCAGFIFHTVALPGSDYDDGFVLTPIDDTKILVEPAQFITVSADDIDLQIEIPVID